MIPITFVTQVDIGDIAAASALVIAIITFYISHAHVSRSEQIKTSRDIWANIDEKFDNIREIAKTVGLT